MNMNQISPYEILDWFLYILIALACLDILIIFLAKAKKPDLKNKYFDFHKKHGFRKITIIKIILVFFVGAIFIDPTGNSFKLSIPLIIYAFFVIKLIVDYLAGKTNGHLRQTMDD
jgi:hypothetical protein